VSSRAERYLRQQFPASYFGALTVARSVRLIWTAGPLQVWTSTGTRRRASLSLLVLTL
jgi:hypothetical protein